MQFRESAGNVLKYSVKYRGVRRPRAYCPALIPLPYLTTNCSVHFGVNTFTHNDHDGNVHFATNLTQKRLTYQNGRLIFINLRLPVEHSPYSPSYNSYNIPVYEIFSWGMVIYDRQIAAIILYIWSTLGNICSKYSIVYCGYIWYLFIYVG